MAAMFCLTLIACCFVNIVQAQGDSTGTGNAVPPKDISDVMRKIFKKKVDSTQAVKKGGVAFLPAFGYNPSLGFVFGAKISAGKQYGDAATTDYSVFGLEAVITTKGIITAQARHNVFTPGNQWNWQGNWQLSRFGMVDYGIGTGKSTYRSTGISVNEFPTENGDSAFPVKYTYIRLFEKVYRKVGKHLYAGAGIGFNIYSGINDERQSGNFNTPHQRYSLKHDFDPDKYSANGVLIALQYNTREHPIRSYGGVYADVSFRFNQRWLGSTKNAIQLQYDFRKYWSLSNRNPEHVVAIWHWASYKLSGSLPYLELPGTASDTYNRSGRAYTMGRFKGLSYACFETEYRFPITRNKFLSGVCFLSMQSASDDVNTKVFSAWEPAAGAGLRVLFQKASRLTLCIDYAKGKYGSQGLFFGLNEVF